MIRPMTAELQKRDLSIHEHMAMGILKKNGVPVPKFSVAKTSQEAFEIAQEFGELSYFMQWLFLKLNSIDGYIEVVAKLLLAFFS